MPRNYVRRSERGNYSAEQLKEAVMKVRSGELSGYHAAAAYNVPRSTIMGRVNGHYGIRSSSMGKARAVPQTVEKQLADTLSFMQLRGFHSGHKELTTLISDYLAKKKIQGFQYSKPSVFWTREFLERYHIKSSQETQDAILNMHFCLIKDTLEEFDLSKRPDRIWCLRENHFAINEYGCLIPVAPDYLNATVVTACNAAGEKAPMLIVLKDNPRFSDDTVYHGSTETGRMDKEVFTTYFKNTFLDNMRAPFMVIYDGNASSIDIKLIEDAREKGVIFLKSPSGYRDVTAALKDKWHNDLADVKDEDQFIATIKRRYVEFGAAQITLGFRKVGIHPFDGGACCYDFPKAWKKYLELKASNSKGDGVESGERSCDDMEVVIPEVVIIKDDDVPEQLIENDNDLTVVVYEDSSSESSKNSRDFFDASCEVVTVSTPPVKAVKNIVKSTSKPDNPKPTPVAPSTSANVPSLLRKRLENSVGTEPIAAGYYGGIIDAARTVTTPRRVCSVFGCRNNESDHIDKDFCPFPADQGLRTRWLQLINRLDLTDVAKAGDSRVCSDHFDRSDYIDGMLKADVVPHLELPRKRVTIVYAPDPNASGFLPATTSEIKTEPNPEVAEAEIQFNAEEARGCFNQSVNKVKAMPSSNYGTKSMAVEPLPMVLKNPPQLDETGVNSIKIVKVEHTPTSTDVPVTEILREPFQNELTFAFEQINIPPTERAPLLSKSIHVQTTKALIDHMNLPMKRKYRGEIKEANNKLKKLERQLNDPKIKKQKFLEYCDEFLDKKISDIVKSQAYLFNRNVGNRYCDDFKSFALSLYLSSPQSYNFVGQIFSLPSKSTLLRFQMPVKTGINEKLIESFKVKVGGMSDREKICALCFDHMAVKKNLYYDVTNDNLCGFQEIDQVLRPEPAQYAILLMARGLYSKWTQPISFAFVAEKTCYPALKDWVLRITALLFDIGLNMKALVTDMDTAFLDLSEVTDTVRHFEVNDRKIYFIFDVPNLFKNARDNFFQYNLHYGSKVAKWSHFSRVYEIDQEEELSLMPKITKDHVKPKGEVKDNVKIAVEVFTYPVAAAMNFHVKTNLVPKVTKDTVEFLTQMSRLYNFLMSQKISSPSEFDQPYRGAPKQRIFLTQSLGYLQMLEPRDKKGNLVDKRLNFVTGLIVTVKSLMSLLQDLKEEKIEYILTRNLSKDCMGAYFSKVRCLGGNDCARPTSIMFARAFRRLFLRHLMSNTNGGKTDMDLKYTMSKISEFVTANALKDTLEQDVNPGQMYVGVTDYQTISLASPTFISGYLLWKCLERHHCQTLLKHFAKQYDIELPANDEATVLKQKFKDYNSSNLDEDGLIKPPKDLVDFVAKMDKMFHVYYKAADLEANGFGWNFYKLIEEETFDMPCPCFPLKLLKCLFIRTKIHQTVKVYNRQNRPKRRRV